MSWKRAAAYWLAALVLGTYYRLVLEPDRSAPPPRAAFVDVDRNAITVLDIERGGRRFRAERAGDAWRVTSGADSVPGDLINALVDSLTDIPAVEVVAEQPADLAQFGLDRPSIVLTVTHRGGAALGVRLGQANPSSTAIYAQRSDAPRVFLIGRNIGYYVDLLLPGT